MSSFGEVLAYFKQRENENSENLAPLIEDVSLRGGLVAWKSISIHYKPAQDCVLKGETEKWDWMWEQVDFDRNLFGTIAGVKVQEALPLLQRLQGLRLVYPDGTINGMAKSYLQAIILSKISGKKSVGRPKQEKS